MLLKGLHEIEMKAGASVMAPEAATTRDVAKAMIHSQRAPWDRSEQMILNNYRTMQRIRQLTDQPLTPQLVLDLHGLVSEKTLDAPGDACHHPAFLVGPRPPVL